MVMLKTAAIVALSALAFSLPALTGAETPLTAVVDGKVHEFPAIGNELYTRSCAIERAWEDGSSVAYCREDGVMWVYDADGDITTGKQAGWYSLGDGR